ncbi:MAG: DEAD/DEAH box helicase [Butyricimonas faecihominis]
MEKFRELGLDGEILKGIADLGFETPSPVQEKAIPVILGEENDLVVLAQTGTGKQRLSDCRYYRKLIRNGIVYRYWF